jgi:hypothetical protein
MAARLKPSSERMRVVNLLKWAFVSAIGYFVAMRTPTNNAEAMAKTTL